MPGCWRVGLFLAQGANNPLAITIRYTLLVVPGFALGTLFWWQRRPHVPAGASPQAGLGRSHQPLSAAQTSNPHRSLSFLVPASVQPWVHSSPA